MTGEGWGQGDGPCLGPEVRGQRLQQTPDLLLAQLYFVIQLPLLDEECGLHFHEVLVVLELLGGQVIGQDVQHHALPPVQVLLELPGILMLASQNLPLLIQRTLRGKPTGKSAIRQGSRLLPLTGPQTIALLNGAKEGCTYVCKSLLIILMLNTVVGKWLW